MKTQCYGSRARHVLSKKLAILFLDADIFLLRVSHQQHRDDDSNNCLLLGYLHGRHPRRCGLLSLLSYGLNTSPSKELINTS